MSFLPPKKMLKKTMLSPLKKRATKERFLKVIMTQPHQRQRMRPPQKNPKKIRMRRRRKVSF